MMIILNSSKMYISMKLDEDEKLLGSRSYLELSVVLSLLLSWAPCDRPSFLLLDE